MRYGATHRGFKSRPLRHPPSCRSARSALSSAGRARRGTSGALYLQSAPAGLNPLPRPAFASAAGAIDVEDRVPRSGDARTTSGPEGSSVKRCSPGAADRPGPSRSPRRARGRHRSTEGARHSAPPCTRPIMAGCPPSPRVPLWPPPTRRSIAAGARSASTRSSARPRSWRRCATASAWAAWRMASSSSGRAAPARPRWRASWPRPSTAPTWPTASPATPALPARRSGKDAPSTWSRWTPPRTTRWTTCASSCRASTPRPRTCVARSSSSTRCSASRRAGTSSSRRSRNRPTTSSSSSAPPTPARSGPPSSRACSASPSDP